MYYERISDTIFVTVRCEPYNNYLHICNCSAFGRPEEPLDRFIYYVYHANRKLEHELGLRDNAHIEADAILEAKSRIGPIPPRKVTDRGHGAEQTGTVFVLGRR